MFNTDTHINNNQHDGTEQTASTESFLARNGRRIAAVAFISIAGSAGLSGIASANGAPSHEGKAPIQDEVLGSDYEEPQWSVPEYAKDPGQFGYEEPVDPEYDGPFEIEDGRGTKVPEVPIDDEDPKDPGEEVPGDTVTTTTTTEPEYPEYPEEEYPDPEVEEKTTERTGGEGLAYTGSDSKLPLVGAGLVLTGGLAAGGSVLSRGLKGARG